MSNTTVFHAIRAVSAALLAGAALSACTVMGTGSGTVASTDAPVSFTWQEKNPDNGTISATLGDGREFTGTYAQRTAAGFFPQDGMRTKEYDEEFGPEVDADLQASDGQRMSCVFRLVNTVGGMGEGARGECRLGDTTIAAVLPRSLPPGV